MNPRELFLEIGKIDEELIEEATGDFQDVRSIEEDMGTFQDGLPTEEAMGTFQDGLPMEDVMGADRDMRMPQRHRMPHRLHRHLLSHKKGIMAAAAVLIIVLATVTWSGGFTALASRISNYISGIIWTSDDVMDLGSAGSLNIGRVDGLDEKLCKRYTSFQDMEKDLGLNLLEYSEPYELTLGGNAWPILLQYFDYNESAWISVPVTITEEDGSSYSFSYEMDFLTGNNGRLGSYGFVGEGIEMELETYTHPNLDVPVALVRMSDGHANACFIYENVRYCIHGIRNEETLKDIVEKLK